MPLLLEKGTGWRAKIALNFLLPIARGPCVPATFAKPSQAVYHVSPTKRFLRNSRGSHQSGGVMEITLTPRLSFAKQNSNPGGKVAVPMLGPPGPRGYGVVVGTIRPLRMWGISGRGTSAQDHSLLATLCPRKRDWPERGSNGRLNYFQATNFPNTVFLFSRGWDSNKSILIGPSTPAHPNHTIGFGPN